MANHRTVLGSCSTMLSLGGPARRDDQVHRVEARRGHLDDGLVLVATG